MFNVNPFRRRARGVSDPGEKGMRQERVGRGGNSPAPAPRCGKCYAIGQSVRFRLADGGMETGWVLRRHRDRLYLVTVNGSRWRVGVGSIDPAGPASLPPPRAFAEAAGGASQRSASWAVGDLVQVEFDGLRAIGRLVTCNAKSAILRLDDGRELRASYGLLEAADSETAQKRQRRQVRFDRLRRRANALLSEHGLDEWTFAWDRARRRGGACDHRTKVISISVGFAEAVDDTEVADTILHEIAHAIVGRSHGHDDVWRRTALRIGCSARVTHGEVFAAPRWEGRCPQGCTRVLRVRRGRYACAKCGKRIVWSRASDADVSRAAATT